MRQRKTVWTCDYCKREASNDGEGPPDSWFYVDLKEIRAYPASDASNRFLPATQHVCDRVCAQAKLRELKAEHDQAFWEHHNSLYPTVVNTPEGWVVETSGEDTNWGGFDKPEAAEVQP